MTQQQGFWVKALMMAEVQNQRLGRSQKIGSGLLWANSISKSRAKDKVKKQYKIVQVWEEHEERKGWRVRHKGTWQSGRNNGKQEYIYTGRGGDNWTQV